jgi:hypothetical protein
MQGTVSHVVEVLDEAYAAGKGTSAAAEGLAAPPETGKDTA